MSRRPNELRDFPRQSLIVCAGYAVAIVVGLAAPGVALAFYVALMVFPVVPFRETGARSRRRSAEE